MKAIKTATTTTGQTAFAIEITDTTELGLAMLIVEDEDGHYEPVGVVASLAEAREVAQDDLRHRMKRLESDGDPLCPSTYKVWARGIDGDYRLAGELKNVSAGR
ncbi:MAG: hypothetical protein ABIZ80_22220 [Bryobacteraceae bacterium]